VINLHRPSNLYANALSDQADVTLVKHMSRPTDINVGRVRYKLLPGSANFFNRYSATNNFVKQQHADLVLVQGFIFPVQVAALRFRLGAKPKILLQHRADVPFKKKKIFQQLADRYVDGYLFTSKEMAKEWIDARVIKNPAKCFELPSSTTEFKPKDKLTSRRETGVKGDPAFLWVGRLNQNKDPFTILHAFLQYAAKNPAAMLYMIYQEDDMLPEVSKYIEEHDRLKSQVKLVGKVPNRELNDWYAAADYFIHASHREGGSFALVEALACGCVPIHTNIPSSQSLAGGTGLNFSPGDVTGLLHTLSSLDENVYKKMSEGCIAHFEKALSAEAIAKKIINIYEALPGK
jgi:glycosyltransferase involved in cell wall biosynthesis